MTTEELIKIIGDKIQTEIIADRYGDASLHANGFVTADPCYIFGSGDKSFSQAAREQQPEAYNGTVREWVEIEFAGRRAFFITCSDGVGPLGHCVDAGWVAAIPLAVCPKAIQKVFVDDSESANN